MYIPILRTLIRLAAAGTLFTVVLAAVCMLQKNHYYCTFWQKRMALLAICLYLLPLLPVLPQQDIEHQPATDMAVVPVNANADVSAPSNMAAAASGTPERIDSAPFSGISAEFAKTTLIVWLTGAGLVLLFHAGTYLWFLQKLKNRSVHIGNLLVRHRFCSSRTVPLLKTDLVNAPALIGLFRPVVLIPTAACASHALHYAIRHERTHLYAHDIAWRWLALTAQCLHWWNPAAWLAAEMLRESSETACDLAVTKTMDSDTRRAYMRALLEFADSSVKRVPLSASVSAQQRRLERRFTMILRQKSLRPASKILSILAACTILATGLWGGTVAANAISPSALDISTEAKLPYTSQLPILVEGDDVCLVDDNGQKALPLQYDSTVYIPAATAAEWLGKEIRWDEDSQVLYLSGSASQQLRRQSPNASSNVHTPQTIRLLPDCTVYLDGVPMVLKRADGNECPPILCGNSVYLPLRSVGEYCGYTVTWYQTGGDCAFIFLRTPLTAEQQHRAETYIDTVEAEIAVFATQVQQMTATLPDAPCGAAVPEDLEDRILDMMDTLTRLAATEPPDLPLLTTCPRTAQIRLDAQQAISNLEAALGHLRAHADSNTYLGYLWGGMTDSETGAVSPGMDGYVQIFSAYAHIIHRVVYQCD